MPTPSHRPAAFSPNRTFVDRDEARALFESQFAQPQGRDDYRVLNYFGIGGQGKTALCAQFEKELQGVYDQGNAEFPALMWATLDFESSENRISLNALLSLRVQLSGRGKLRFPAFDSAFKRYVELTQPAQDFAARYPELRRYPNDIFAKLAQGAEKLTGLSWSKILELGYQGEAAVWLHRWRARRGDALLADLASLAAYQLEEALPKYLGADIDDWLHEQDVADRRVVLLFDTYEALWRDHPHKTDANVDAWVRRLVAECDSTLHVVLGRESLHWHADQPNENWQAALLPCALDNMPDQYAEDFLQAMPIVEADIRARMVAGAQGIPFYLNLQVDQYAVTRRAGNTPLAADYGGAQQPMLDRFINHLPRDVQAALRLAAYPRWLDETLFLALSQDFLGGIGGVRFSELVAYSFWYKQAGRYTLHAVMRDYLQADSQKNDATLFRQVHQHLFERHDHDLQALDSARDLTTRHAETLSAGAYHLAQSQRERVPYWVGKYREFFHRAGQWTVLQPLLELSISICREMGDKAGEGATLNNLSQIYDARGDYATALSYLQQSLAIRQAIGDKAGLCATLFNMGHIHWQADAQQEALQTWVTVYRIAQAIGEAQALAALEKLAAQIGLPNGLQGWARLAENTAQFPVDEAIQ